MLQPKMPFLNDAEGERIPSGLTCVIDSHVHLFPESIFSAVWKWFDSHAWHIRYQQSSSQLIDFLLSHGVHHVVGLQYAHKPGIARLLNEYMHDKVKQFDGQLTGLATVYPGEKGAVEVLQEAFDLGLKGVKLHMHVQCFDLNGNYMLPLYKCCLQNNKPLVIHAGREPKSKAYACDPYAICGTKYVEKVLNDFPGLKICVPHLGFDEVDAYRNLLEKYDNLWLDTTMALTDYFPECKDIDITQYRSDRVMYGSDFPNIPYAWDRELKALNKTCSSKRLLENITHKNAVDFFGIDYPS